MKILNKYKILLLFIISLFSAFIFYIHYGFKKMFFEVASSVMTASLISSVLYAFYRWVKDDEHKIFVQETIKEVLHDKRVFKYVIGFSERVSDMRIENYVREAKEIFVIMVYGKGLLQENLRFFESVLKNGGEINLVVPDHEQEEVLRINSSRFSKPESVKDKIVETVDYMGDIFNSIESGSINIYYFPNIISYSSIIIDKKILFLSVFEHFEAARAGPPCIIINLENSDHLFKEFSKEIKDIMNFSINCGRVERLCK